MASSRRQTSKMRFLSLDRGHIRSESSKADSKSRARPQIHVEAFRKSVLVDTAGLRGLEVSALECQADKVVFVGTVKGYLAVITPDGDMPIKTRIGAKPVSQLQLIPDLDILVAMCDGRLTYHIPSTLRKLNSCKDTSIPNSLAAWNARNRISSFKVMTSKPYDLCASVRKQKKLVIAMWDHTKRAYLQDKELAIPDYVAAMEWYSQSPHVALGFKSNRYSILYAPDAKSNDPEVPVECSVMLHAVNDVMLVTASVDLGIFLKHTGHPAPKDNVSFALPPLTCAHLGCYIVAILSDGKVEVISMIDKRVNQMIDTKEARFIATGKTKIWVSSSEAIYVLKAIPIPDQVNQLIGLGNVSEAEKLLVKNRPTTKDIEDFHWKAGWMLIRGMRFEESFTHLSRSNSDPRRILKLFPELNKSNLNNTTSAGKKGIHSMLAKAENPKKDLEQAQLHLLLYLWQYRSFQSGRRVEKETKKLKEEYRIYKEDDELEKALEVKAKIDQVEKEEIERLTAVDTAILVLFVGFTWDKRNLRVLSSEQKEILDRLPFSSLSDLLLPTNHCALDECADYLQNGVDSPQEADLAVLLISKKMYKEALQVFHDLSTGKRRQRGQDGILPTVELLSRIDLSKGDLEPELLWHHARWVLKANPTEGIRIFTIDRVPPFNPDQVIKFLTSLSFLDEELDLVSVYLGYLTRRTDIVRFHDLYVQRLYSRYVALVESGCDEDRIEDARDELKAVMETNNKFDLQRMLEIIEKSGLDEEKVVLFSRLGKHRQALEIYIFSLQDYMAAEDYCLTKGRKNKTEKRLFEELLRIYVDAKEGKVTPDEGDEKMIEFVESAFQHLLAYQSEYLDPVKTLELIPNDTELQTIQIYLESVMRASVSRRRNAQIVSKLVRAERFDVQMNLLELKRKAFTINTKTECYVCRKKIGDSIFAAHPPDDTLFPGRFPSAEKWIIVHKGCSRKYEELRKQGKMGVGRVLHVK
ncbi:hypothetical protein AAMO2058_000527700 [Amorphochlora amoebiformis]